MVRQLDAQQHQAEPRLEELFVGGRQVVSQAPGLQVGEEAAGPSVSQEGAEVVPGGTAVVGLVVSQGEGEVEVVALPSTNISQWSPPPPPWCDLSFSAHCSLSPLQDILLRALFASTSTLDFSGLKVPADKNLTLQTSVKTITF